MLAASELGRGSTRQPRQDFLLAETEAALLLRPDLPGEDLIAYAVYVTLATAGAFGVGAAGVATGDHLLGDERGGLLDMARVGSSWASSPGSSSLSHKRCAVLRLDHGSMWCFQRRKKGCKGKTHPHFGATDGRGLQREAVGFVTVSGRT
jgi:hypothetical protein